MTAAAARTIPPHIDIDPQEEQPLYDELLLRALLDRVAGGTPINRNSSGVQFG
ncbi:hypothetical protein ABT024_05050 [Streptomyces sp. NPDC002812]|uniref:hypothetical protein n=1 Tax=Streptomyces sp. NPDC002812 TaxID=3154434 RepID=UPI00332B0B48